MASDDKFQFVEQNSVECWCDLGTNLMQYFIGRYSRYSRYRTIFTIFDVIYAMSITARDNYSLTAIIISTYKKLCIAGLFVFVFS